MYNTRRACSVCTRVQHYPTRATALTFRLGYKHLRLPFFAIRSVWSPHCVEATATPLLSVLVTRSDDVLLIDGRSTVCVYALRRRHTYVMWFYHFLRRDLRAADSRLFMGAARQVDIITLIERFADTRDLLGSWVCAVCISWCGF